MNFQTELILNDLSKVLASATVGSADKGVMIGYGAWYPTAKISTNGVKSTFTKTNPTDGVYAKWAIDAPLASYLKDKTIRYSVNAVLVGDVRSDYDRFMIYKGKPLNCEISLPSDIVDDLAAADYIVSELNRYFTKAGASDILAERATLETKTVITLTAKMYSLTFNSFIMSEGRETATSTYSGMYEYATVSTGRLVSEAVQPFGTAWYITKNLRMPTTSNTRFMGLDAEERPIDGAKYAEYSFDFTSERDITGIGAVGQLMTSQTNHIVFVKSDLVTAFEAILTGEGISTVLAKG